MFNLPPRSSRESSDLLRYTSICYIPTQCLHCTYIVPTRYLHCAYTVNTSWLHCTYILTTLYLYCSSLYLYCAHTVPALYLYCSSLYLLCPHCTCIVPTLYLHCTRTFTTQMSTFKFMYWSFEVFIKVIDLYNKTMRKTKSHNLGLKVYLMQRGDGSALPSFCTHFICSWKNEN